MIFLHTPSRTRRRVRTIGAALDSLILLLEIGLIATVIVLVLAIWKGVLSGNLKTSLIRRKPLLVPSLVFSITIIIVMTSLPLPMSVDHGVNQLQYDSFASPKFRVYEAGAYEADTLVRVAMSVEPDERLEIYAYFSQDEAVIGSLFINITYDILDAYGGVTRSISLEPGLYDVTVNATYIIHNVEQDEMFPQVLINQPTSSSFIPEVTSWSTYQFVLGIVCLFLVLGGICIGREDRTRRSEEDIDQEPPREGEVYGRRLGW
ncbi:MAG: hypothetical protein ACW97G_09840 [Candidatus Thorarchaeota archaeon]